MKKHGPHLGALWNTVAVWFLVGLLMADITPPWLGSNAISAHLHEDFFIFLFSVFFVQTLVWHKPTSHSTRHTTSVALISSIHLFLSPVKNQTALVCLWTTTLVGVAVCRRGRQLHPRCVVALTNAPATMYVCKDKPLQCWETVRGNPSFHNPLKARAFFQWTSPYLDGPRPKMWLLY